MEAIDANSIIIPRPPLGVDVYPVGTKVWIGYVGDRVEATILQISINANDYVQYQVAWWEKTSTRKVEWVDACEIEPRAPTAMKTIGFKG